MNNAILETVREQLQGEDIESLMEEIEAISKSFVGKTVDEWVSEKGKLKKRKVELGKTDEETSTTKIKSGLSEDDYIAWADDTYKEGMKTTTEYQTETDGDANAS